MVECTDLPSNLATDSYPLQLIVLPGEEIQRHLPETLHVEATPIPWDISIRSDKEGQHSAFAEVSSLFDPLINHFILSDSTEQEYTRTVVFAVFSSKYEFSGACHWTRVTKVWDILDLRGGDKGWVVYHNNQRLEHRRVSVHHGDVFACYERNNPHTPFQADRVEYDAAKERVAAAPESELIEAAEPIAPELSNLEAVGDDSQVGTVTFEQTGDPLLLIGRASGQRSQGDTAEALYRSPFQ